MDRADRAAGRRRGAGRRRVVRLSAERRPFRPPGVHVEYRDRFSVVIANDGSLFPGDVVATCGAQQLQLALKNKAGGGIDPHAGHNH